MNKKFLLFYLLLILTSCSQRQVNHHMPKNIRQPAVAGQFYPADDNRLKLQIEKYLQSTTPSPSLERRGVMLPPLAKGRAGVGLIKAIMVPHAGYDYSASVAAESYKAIEANKYDNVFMICNSHTAYFSGIAIDDHNTWATPLGDVDVNLDLARKIIDNDIIKFDSSPHQREHSLEAQLPFLQTVLSPGFKIVPILFGNDHDKDYEILADALSRNIGENDLIVISTDMSHYPSYANANRIDKQTLEDIKSSEIERLASHIYDVEAQNIPNEQTLLCGIDGVKTIMRLAKSKNWQPEILNYQNSGDAPDIGDKDQVVGYGAMIFASQKLEVKSEEEIPNNELKNISILSQDQQSILLDIAKQTVESFVREGRVPEFDIKDERLNWQEGAFVTLHKDKKLRGCIGQIEPSNEPLWKVVREMAVATCSEDDRFMPVSIEELEKIEYEVSVLSRPEKIDDWRKIELGKHGVIIRQGHRGGVFLPQVATETGWTLEEFLSQLCFQKAGLPPDCYKDPETQIETFTAQVF
jgi:MEMO1 family protein